MSNYFDRLLYDWKVVKPRDGDYEFYNLREDLSEKNDLSAQFSEIKNSIDRETQYAGIKASNTKMDQLRWLDWIQPDTRKV
ncbi:hypothetical protein OU798_06560 [Prolixibacteraceae bacterium Z1-6]|uniref:Uncharacterized protein n=1 Tax=Draconibacterium aestuarii TaxID=2998507 RepID=A0A9X3J5K2_9BACT|nr:hypothetical protein [Prolixibacteraceae bacterium Z1-6]